MCFISLIHYYFSYYNPYFTYYFSYYFKRAYYFSYYFSNYFSIISLIYVLFPIISGLSSLDDTGSQAHIFTLYSEKWLTRDQEWLQGFWISRIAHFIKKNQQVQPLKTYYTPYFFYYTDYLKCLTSIERLVISICALQAYVHQIYLTP